MLLCVVSQLWMLLFTLVGNTFGSFTLQHGEFYITLHNNTLKTWDEAGAACRNDGGGLVSISSHDLQIKITSLLTEWEKNLVSSDFRSKWRTGYHISGRKEKSTSFYIWRNGKIVPGGRSKIGYENWYWADPNCENNVNCYMLINAVSSINDTYTGTMGKWMDIACEPSSSMYYICEVPTHYNPCYNGGNYVLVNSNLTCNCPSQYSGKLCEIFFYPNSNVLSNDFTLTCRVEGSPLSNIHWTITSSLCSEHIISDTFDADSPFVIHHAHSSSIITESNFTITGIGLCLGPSTISCWDNSNVLLHQFNLNQESYETIGQNYFVFSEISTNISKNASVQACNKLGGELASITDNITQNELIKLLNDKKCTNRVWIGLRKLNNGIRVWPNQQVASYTNRKVNEAQTMNNCAFMGKGEQRKWELNQCKDTSATGYYICKVKNIDVPTIVSIETAPCNKGNSTMFAVKWKPSPNTTNFTHEIKIRDKDNDIDTKLVDPQTSFTENRIISTSFGDLNPRTEYNIMISVAPSVCTKPVITAKTVMTGYVTPNSVQSANFHLSDNNTCVVTWIMPTESVPTFQHFVVNVTKKPHVVAMESFEVVYELITKESFIRNVSLYRRSILFKALPNRVHDITIYAQSCAGDGPTIVAQGECFVPRSAPSLLPCPVFTSKQIPDYGFLSISLESVDDTNGPLSCIFVIAQYHDSNVPVKAKSSQEFFENLSNQNISAVTDGQEYLAVALSRIPRKQTIIKLGDGNITSCNIYQLPNLVRARKRRASSNKPYIATNLKLIPNKFYSIYIVSSTPLKGGNVKFFASSVTSHFVHSSTEEQVAKPKDNLCD